MKSTASKPETDWAQEEAEQILPLPPDDVNSHGRRGWRYEKQLEIAQRLHAAEERGHARGIEDAAKLADKNQIIFLEWRDSTFTSGASQERAEGIANSMADIAAEIRALARTGAEEKQEATTEPGGGD